MNLIKLLCILFLNRANRVTGRMKISQGGVSGKDYYSFADNGAL